jgi:hypothetical protein
MELNAATLSSDQKHGKTTPWGYNNITNGRDSSSSSQMHNSATTNSGYYLGSTWQQSTKVLPQKNLQQQPNSGRKKRRWQ